MRQEIVRVPLIIEEPDGTIPFESQFFDIVVNNQVMEHVDDLDRTLREIHRVLKPGGRVLSLFPAKEVWREGHCGIPFLHWFPKYSQPRIYYAAACRFVGLGYHKRDKSVWEWSRDFCGYLDKWTYYRTPEEIYSAYEKYFIDLQHIEDIWLQLRFGLRRPAPTWLPGFLQRIFVRKLAGWVFCVRKV
jgi:SAM-dependent methyltransferase